MSAHRTRCVRYAGKTSVFLGDTSRASVGDEVAYTFVVTNDGTTTLSDAVISDTVVSASYNSACKPLRDGVLHMIFQFHTLRNIH